MMEPIVIGPILASVTDPLTTVLISDNNINISQSIVDVRLRCDGKDSFSMSNKDLLLCYYFQFLELNV